MSDIADRVSNVVVSKLHVEPDEGQRGRVTFIDDFAATSLDIVETIHGRRWITVLGIEISDRDARELCGRWAMRRGAD